MQSVIMWLFPIRRVLALCAVATLFVAPQSLRANDADLGRIRVGTVAHGVEMSLTIPRQSYARNALVPVEAQIKNVTHHTLLLQAACGVPTVQVIDAHGNVLYPPAVMNFEWECQAVGPVPLAAGQDVADHDFIIARAGRLRATVDIMQVTNHVAHLVATVHTDAVIRLTREPAPRTVIHRSSRPSADVYPRTTATGPLRMVYQFDCNSPQGSGGGWGRGTRAWTATTSTHLVSPDPIGCGPKRAWTVVAGWVNHPVVTIRVEHL